MPASRHPQPANMQPCAAACQPGSAPHLAAGGRAAAAAAAAGRGAALPHPVCKLVAYVLEEAHHSGLPHLGVQGAGADLLTWHAQHNTAQHDAATSEQRRRNITCTRHVLRQLKLKP